MTSINVDAVSDQLIVEYNKLLKRRPFWFEALLLQYKLIPVSAEYRRYGNDSFNNALDLEAHVWYTKSVAAAPKGSEELALAYGNRSAASIRLRKYVSGLLDVNRALCEPSCPEKLKEKLRARKEKCLIEINREKDTAQFGNPIEADATEPIAVVDSVEETAWRDLIGNFNNPTLPNASTKIKIECDERWGRYLTAAEDIESGEILSSQSFAALVLQQDLIDHNCSYCLAECNALIPCPSCSQVMYCSTLCCNRAHNSYHRIECKIITELKPLRVFKEYEVMALRMLLIGTEQGTQLQNLMKRLPKRDIFRERDDPTNQPFVNDYISVLKLCRTFQPSLVASLTSKAVQIIAMLKRVGFFGIDFTLPLETMPQEVMNTLSETELFAALLFINHASAALSNLFAIAPVTFTQSNLSQTCDKVYASGVSTLHNLLNHSCNPDVHFFTRNREHVLMATRPIKKGQQIFYSYFNIFSSNSLEERHDVLSKFGFVCHCIACCNFWPLELDLMKQRTEFINDRKKAKEEFAVMKSSITRKDINKGGSYEILRAACRMCKWFHTNVRQPSAAIVHSEAIVYNLTLLLFDDFTKAYWNKRSREYYVKLILEATENYVLKS